MATEHQISELRSRLKDYTNRYLRKEFSKLDEAATRIMIDNFLTEVLGYKELIDIKTEYRIRGEYADYVIQTGRKKQFVVEVKSIQFDLNENHLRQSLNYAANEGIDWILLLNGRQLELYHVSFGKPVSCSRVFSINLLDKVEVKKTPEMLVYLTKKCVVKNELDSYWKRTSAITPENFAKSLYSEEVARIVRNDIKNETGIYFQIDDIAEVLYEVITKKVDLGRPRLKSSDKKKK